MFKNKIVKILSLTIVPTIIVVYIIFTGTQPNFLQGALHNLQPIYKECRIEGNGLKDTNLENCENFTSKLKENTFPDGEYTIFAKYNHNELPENIIPIKISENGKNFECTYLENGYKPQIEVSPIDDKLTTQKLSPNQEIPIYEQGTLVTINFDKNNQRYIYDTNICEKGLNATIYDGDKNKLGEAKLDTNGFINSRQAVNELLIANLPYYIDTKGKIIKDFEAGNLYTTLNFAPDIFFKLTIPCSKEIIKISIPTLETDKDISIPFEGFEEKYLKKCGSKLYLSLQNTNQADDIQIIDKLNLDPNSKKPAYNLKLSKITRVTDKETVFPISFKVSLHLRDRSDSNEIITLGTGLLTVTNYKTKKPKSPQETKKEIISEINATSDITPADKKTQNKPKVKRQK